MKGPLFSFYGAKWRAAPLYPQPLGRIVELFAGSACYACRYPDRQVTLIERDPRIAALWRYLIRVSPSEIRALPDADADTCASDYPAGPEARDLLGFWMNQGSSAPRKHFARRHREPAAPRFEARKMWARAREQVAIGVAEIKHWRILEGSWEDLWDHAVSSDPSTWFVDPPYAVAGRCYVHNTINYSHLASLCMTLAFRSEHVIACEAEGASWLPFRPLAKVRASSRNGARYSREVVWTNEGLHAGAEHIPGDGAAFDAACSATRGRTSRGLRAPPANLKLARRSNLS